MKNSTFFIAVVLATVALPASAQNTSKKAGPADTEVWEPVPKVVAPGKSFGEAPADAIILFDGKSLDEWVSVKDGSAAKWPVAEGVFTVNKPSGNIMTKRKFTNYQLHLEFQIPANISGTGQSRGNSGLFLASTGGGDSGYEIQIMDSYNNENKTYVNGMVGSIYKQAIPLVNPERKAGEWNVYDIIWTAPVFNEDGTVKSQARVTVFLNGVLIQNNYELKGETLYIGAPVYKNHGPSPIKLQAHGDPSEPISFRNIWVRDTGSN